MTIITVIIESTFSGPAGGFHGVRIDDSEPVRELIRQFCDAKGTPSNPNYVLITKNNVLLVNKQPISDFLIQNGQVLKLVSRKNNDYKLLFRQWMTMAGLGIFVAVVGLTASILLFVVFGTVPDNYAMVIDAGYTQTDMILYSWPGEKLNNTGEAFEVSKCVATGGLAHVNPGHLDKYFDACFDELYELVLPESRKNAQVLFGVTQDIRLLNQSDPNLAAKIIKGVQEYVKQSKWQYASSNEGIPTSSLTEGIGEWISSNYWTISEQGSVDDTFGILELNDTSAQIAFVVPKGSHTSPDVYPVTLFGNEFRVFGQSHLCSGVEQALRRYHALLLIEHLGSEANYDNITSPCEPLGWTFSPSNSYFSSVCVGADLEYSEENNSWSFIGSGNYPECERIVSKLLNYTECSSAKLGHCVDPSKFPDGILRHQFYAYSAYSSIAHGLGIQAGASLLEARRHIKVMCDYSVDELDGGTMKSKRAFERLCFEGQYMFALLTEVYGFNSDSKWGQVTFMSENPGWSLGYMINATQDIDAVPRVPKLKLLPFTLLTILFIIFFFLSVLFIIHGLKIRKQSQGYQRF